MVKELAPSRVSLIYSDPLAPAPLPIVATPRR